MCLKFGMNPAATDNTLSVQLTKHKYTTDLNLGRYRKSKYQNARIYLHFLANMSSVKFIYSSKIQCMYFKFCKTLVTKYISIFLSKFPTFVLFILVLVTFAIILQTACCYAVTTWPIVVQCDLTIV